MAAPLAVDRLQIPKFCTAPEKVRQRGNRSGISSANRFFLHLLRAIEEAGLISNNPNEQINLSSSRERSSEPTSQLTLLYPTISYQPYQIINRLVPPPQKGKPRIMVMMVPAWKPKSTPRANAGEEPPRPVLTPCNCTKPGDPHPRSALELRKLLYKLRGPYSRNRP